MTVPGGKAGVCVVVLFSWSLYDGAGTEAQVGAREVISCMSFDHGPGPDAMVMLVRATRREAMPSPTGPLDLQIWGTVVLPRNL
jgi:hypothetical protein